MNTKVLVVAVADEDGNVLDTFEAEIDAKMNDRDAARLAVRDVADQISYGIV